MTRYKELKCVDVTIKKSKKIEYLQRMVDEASTTEAMAASKYNSFVEKAAIFATLYNEAEADLTTAEGYWKLFLQVKSDLEGLNDTANEANLIAVESFQDIKQLICDWEEVTSETLKAAEAITLTANYIQKRKSSNPLISNDLVNDAIAASKAAQKVVTKVVNAFTDALNALSSSKQANNSTELTNVYISLAIASLLNKEIAEQLKQFKNNRSITFDNSIYVISDVKKVVYNQLDDDQTSLEISLKTALDKAKSKVKSSLDASEKANQEMNRAKEELEQAKAALATWDAALVAAETAVAG
ncbi:MAG: hypothetical protein AB8H03_11100 [Saprospiraceae bacterium]